MPNRTRYDEGVPCWVSIETPNEKATKSFYEELFDWEFTAAENAADDLWALRNTLPVAGLRVADRENAEWLSYFACEDVDRCVDRVEQAGGRLERYCTNAGDKARVSMMVDHSGTRFGLWEAGEQIGAEIVNEHGALNWNELVTDDPGAAVDFYGRALGLAPAEPSPSPDGYTELRAVERPVVGILPKPIPDLPNFWGVYFAIDVASSAADRLAERGGSITRGPLDVEHVGIIIRAIDPQGARLSLIELASEID